MNPIYHEAAALLSTAGAVLVTIGVTMYLDMHPTVIKVAAGAVAILGVSITWLPWWATTGTAVVLAVPIAVAIKGEYDMIAAASRHTGVPAYDDDDD